MSNIETINAIEDQVKELRKQKDLGDSLKKLESNKDFRAVIKSGYFEKEAVRLVHLRGDPSMATPEKQAEIIKSIDAIAALNMYFRVVLFTASQADSAIMDAESMLEELRAEGN